MEQGEVFSNSLSDVNILLIDDDAGTRDILSNFLENLGLRQVHQSRTALEAIEFIDSQQQWTGVVLCDWNMPEMSGAAFHKHLKKKRPNLPFIMISGRNDEDSILFAKDSGVTSYLLKPVAIEELERKLRAAATSAFLS